MNYKYIFGPVNSRRLGKSLGIDLFDQKICSFNCIYCECGATNVLTNEIKEYVPTVEVINELEHYLTNNTVNIDYITFSGSGEPTMHSGIGKIINFLKENYPQYKIALLTNSSLLTDKVIKKINNIDLIVPSLDAATDQTFQKINKPKFNIKISQIISDLIKLRNNFDGQIWLEILIIPGINDTIREIEQFKKVIKKINPDKVQLNTLDRPGTVQKLKPSSQKKLSEIAAFLGEKTEIVISNLDTTLTSS